MQARTWIVRGAIFSVTLGMLASVVGAPAAHADYAPGSYNKTTGTGDIVGVGSDTVQYIADFAFDGDVNGDSGFNTPDPHFKAISFDATADSNARASYANPSSSTSPNALNPTTVLRAGTFPVQRPNGSSAGIAAILADTTGTAINFVRASREPKAAEQTQAGSEGYGFLHVVQVSTDGLQMAAANTTNAPAGLSPAELVAIYQCTTTKWSQLNASLSGDTIIPEIPQAGSGTRSQFLSDLQTANGGTAITLGSCVATVEENDPVGITSAANPADAIDPFSAGRLNLYNSGYFHTPATPFPGGAVVNAGIKLITGTAPDGSASYLDNRGLFFVFRNTDASLPSGTSGGWEPGGTTNWVQTLFSNPGGAQPFFAKTSTHALISAAGATPNYQDLGNVSSG